MDSSNCQQFYNYCIARLNEVSDLPLIIETDLLQKCTMNHHHSFKCYDISSLNIVSSKMKEDGFATKFFLDNDVIIYEISSATFPVYRLLDGLEFLNSQYTDTYRLKTNSDASILDNCQSKSSLFFDDNICRRINNTSLLLYRKCVDKVFNEDLPCKIEITELIKHNYAGYIINNVIDNFQKMSYHCELDVDQTTFTAKSEYRIYLSINFKRNSNRCYLQ